MRHQHSQNLAKETNPFGKQYVPFKETTLQEATHAPSPPYTRIYDNSVRLEPDFTDKMKETLVKTPVSQMCRGLAGSLGGFTEHNIAQTQPFPHRIPVTPTDQFTPDELLTTGYEFLKFVQGKPVFLMEHHRIALNTNDNERKLNAFIRVVQDITSLSLNTKSDNEAATEPPTRHQLFLNGKAMVTTEPVKMDLCKKITPFAACWYKCHDQDRKKMALAWLPLQPPPPPPGTSRKKNKYKVWATSNLTGKKRPRCCMEREKREKEREKEID